MHNQTKISFLFCNLTLFLCLSFFFAGNSTAQVNIEPVAAPADSKYTFESISVDGVELLAVTASSDFGDYAGHTLSADGEKKSVLRSLTGNLNVTITRVQRTPISMRLAMMGPLPGSTKMVIICAMASSWKMANCGNGNFRIPFKQRFTVSVTRQAHLREILLILLAFAADSRETLSSNFPEHLQHMPIL